ncbi:M15 family metallopeptidase [Jeotgalibacillus sp. ET6]|nr:M15 family metallopeptidase [Jeotgalibacillus sp. ET6]MDG5471850.1 M15 family metallopeptidase [Jeotgalibacillus sp. ET6]
MKKGLNLLFLATVLAVIIWLLAEEHQRREELADVPMPTALHPIVEQKKNELIDQAARQEIDIVITDGFRSVEEQDALYERGRSQEGNIVTNARGGESYHNYGLAIDFAIRTSEESVVWDMDYDGNNNERSDWMEVVEIAKDLGFSWGGDWHGFKDYPHFEMRFGLSIRELQRGERPD